MDNKLEVFGRADSAREIRLHPRLINIETTLGILVHEGRHALDIEQGVVPSSKKATPFQQLLAEGRAWASELEFLWKNRWQESNRWHFVFRPPRELLIDIETSYNIEGVTSAEFRDIWKNHMSLFPYG